MICLFKFPHLHHLHASNIYVTLMNKIATLRKDNASDDEEAKRHFLRCTHAHGGDSPQFSLQSHTRRRKITASNVVDPT